MQQGRFKHTREEDATGAVVWDGSKGSGDKHGDDSSEGGEEDAMTIAVGGTGLFEDDALVAPELILSNFHDCALAVLGAMVDGKTPSATTTSALQPSVAAAASTAAAGTAGGSGDAAAIHT